MPQQLVFIQPGSMGGPMAARPAADGHRLAVLDMDPAALDASAARGSLACKTCFIRLLEGRGGLDTEGRPCR